MKLQNSTLNYVNSHLFYVKCFTWCVFLFYESVSMGVCVCTRVHPRAAEPPRWQGLSIMINRQTRQLSHTITLHYSSQDLKVKMNGSSSTRRLHISLFLFPPLFSRSYFHVENVLLSRGLLASVMVL